MPAAKGTAPWNAGTGKGWTDKKGYRWTKQARAAIARATGEQV